MPSSDETKKLKSQPLQAAEALLQLRIREIPDEVLKRELLVLLHRCQDSYGESLWETVRTLNLRHEQELKDCEGRYQSEMAKQAASSKRTLEFLHDEVDRLREQKDYLKQIEPKTGCLNQKYFEEEVLALTLQRACSNRRKDDRRSPWIALWYIDMHQFKMINDKISHQTGDRVLAAFGKLLCHGIRFIEKEDFPARMGGDEFAVLMKHVTDVETPFLTASRFREIVAKHDWISVDPGFKDHLDLLPQADIGIACLSLNSIIGCKQPELVQKMLLFRAEELMKESKENDGDIYVRNVQWVEAKQQLEEVVVEDFFTLRPENDRRHQP